MPRKCHHKPQWRLLLRMYYNFLQTSMTDQIYRAVSFTKKDFICKGVLIVMLTAPLWNSSSKINAKSQNWPFKKLTSCSHRAPIEVHSDKISNYPSWMLVLGKWKTSLRGLRSPVLPPLNRRPRLLETGWRRRLGQGSNWTNVTLEDQRHPWGHPLGPASAPLSLSLTTTQLQDWFYAQNINSKNVIAYF